MTDLLDLDSPIDLSERILEAYERLGRSVLFRTVRPDSYYKMQDSCQPSTSGATAVTRVLEIANEN